MPVLPIRRRLGALPTAAVISAVVCISVAHMTETHDGPAGRQQSEPAFGPGGWGVTGERWGAAGDNGALAWPAHSAGFPGPGSGIRFSAGDLALFGARQSGDAAGQRCTEAQLCDKNLSSTCLANLTQVSTWDAILSRSGVALNSLGSYFACTHNASSAK